ncbi:MAG: hypothetical protein LBD75_02920 [Candidatus Peribacteria bacterium]|jgi:hypothetical protein|nr:hypothetical protein [Candidatus Peribacteria bacterium]
MCSNDRCILGDIDILSSLIGTSNTNTLTIDTAGINFDSRSDEQISTAIINKIPNDISSFFHIKDIDPTCTNPNDENTCSTEIKFGQLTQTDFNNTSLTQEITSEIQRLFIGKNADEPLKIEGLNLLTPDRPIDSPHYITFQGINAQEVKLIYPDLYKVEVYNADAQGHQILKTIPEIKAAIQTYLQNKVREYNAILTGAEATKNFTNAQTAAFNRLITSPLNFTRAVPNNRTYQGHLFTYSDLLSTLGGEAQLDIIAEMLYYQNLTNTEKQSNNLITEDIANTRSSFDISNKVKYTLQEYLTENNPKLQRANS